MRFPAGAVARLPTVEVPRPPPLSFTHQTPHIILPLPRRLRQRRPMLVKIDPLSDAGRFVAEELAAVVGCDSGAGVEGLDRVPKGFYGDAEIPFVKVDPGLASIADDAGFQDRGCRGVSVE